MPFDGHPVEKLYGYLLRGLRALRAAILGLCREGRLYGIHTSAIREFEACGQRLRDGRIGREQQKAGKRGSGEAGKRARGNHRGVTLSRRRGGRSLASSAIPSCWPMPSPLPRFPASSAKHISVNAEVSGYDEEPQ